MTSLHLVLSKLVQGVAPSRPLQLPTLVDTQSVDTHGGERIHHSIPPEARLILSQLLQLDPGKRPSAGSMLASGALPRKIEADPPARPYTGARRQSNTNRRQSSFYYETTF